MTQKFKDWLCGWGLHRWRWEPGNKVKCLNCGKIEVDLP